jgi:hypothetical protein
MRRLRVDRPGELIPNPTGLGLRQTNAETIEGYLQQLSPSGDVRVNRAAGGVSTSPDFCRSRGFLGRLWRGLESGFLTGGRIGAYALGIGAIPGALIGALIGGIAGIFGADAQAEETSTPTGSTCICDFINAASTWSIRIDDSDTPLTGDDFVRVQSPNSPRIFGAATVSGRLENVEPWLALGHELCGHAWLDLRREREQDVPGEHTRHRRTVERENLLRREHGLEARGFRLKDPFCGESFSRSRETPAGPVEFQRYYDERTRQFLRGQGRNAETDRTYLDECQQMREQYLGDDARRFRVDQRIP